MGDKKICSITLSLELETVGLLGGKWEYNPYLSLYTSFGDDRVNSEKDFLQLKNAPTTTTPHHQPESMTIYENDDSKKSKNNKEKEKEEDNDDEKKIVGVSVVRDPLTYVSRSYTFELDDYDEMRGDDAIKFKLFCFTRFSGVPYLDKLESDYVEREISEGLFHIELVDLFRMFFLNEKKSNFIVLEEFVDTKIVDEKIKDLAGTDDISYSVYDKLEPEARKLTKKANVKVMVQVNNFNQRLYEESIFHQQKNFKEVGLFAHLNRHHQSSMLSSNNNGDNRSIGDILTKRKIHTPTNRPEFRCMLYNSKVAWNKMGNSMTNLLNIYCDYFIKMNQNHRPRHKPSEPQIANLQLLFYNSENGRMPVYCYWSNHEPFFREYATNKAKLEALKRYPLAKNSEEHLLLILRSSLRRHGLSMERFIRALKNHFSKTNQSYDIESDFIVAEESITQMGTFTANQAYYMADYRLINVATNATPNATKKDHKCKKCGKLTVKVFDTDSWDNNIMNDTSMCDDCEGQGNVVSDVLRVILIGRYDLGHTWESEALQAIQQLYLKYTNIFDNAALVTSAFMNTDNKKVELQQADDLPLIGSDMDKNAKNDGHCFVTVQSQQKSIKMLTQGNIDRSLLRKMEHATYISDEFTIREEQRQPLVLEPTGSIEPRITSVVESYKKYPVLLRKKKAEVLLMRKMRTIAKSDPKKYESIISLINGEGMPHYIEEQDPHRRISSFYNSVVHATSVDLMQRFGSDCSLAQFAVCKDISGDACYGVRIGELLRGDSKTKLSLISPFVGRQDEWARDMSPMIETIQNQMPIQRFGRYSDEQYKNDIYSIYVSLDEIDDKFSFKKTTASSRRIYGTPGNVVREQEAFEKILDTLDDNTTVLRLYSRTWKLDKNTKDRKDLFDFILSVPGIRCFGVYIEKHLPVCEPIVQFLCIVDVEIASK
jgi:hypothetical protein